MTCCNNDKSRCPRCGSNMLEEQGQRWCSLCDYVEPKRVEMFTEIRKLGEKRK